MDVFVNQDDNNDIHSNGDFVDEKSKKSVLSLHPIEKKIISILKDNKDNKLSENQLQDKSNLSVDQIRRGIEWLKFKELILVQDESDYFISLSSGNQNPSFLPERKLVNIIKNQKNLISDIIKDDEFKHNEKEVYGAIRFGKKNHWIEIKDNVLFLLNGYEKPSEEELFINKLNKSKLLKLSELNQNEVKTFELLKKRPNILIIKKVSDKKYSLSDYGLSTSESILENEYPSIRKMTVTDLLSGDWKIRRFEHIDVEAPVPLLNYGRKNPLIDFIDEVKEILIGMGFAEIEGNFSQSCFWNFDALFIPQDHSAREMQDTFYLQSDKSLLSDLPSFDVVNKVSDIHQQNWHYKWDAEESKPYVLRTHTTPVTLQYLFDKRPEQDKIFLVGRVFRNEKVTFKHLIEFHQIEGIFTNKDANLRELIGIQTEFYKKLGIKKIKFWPTFFPYTEPSLQSMIFNEKYDKWIELFGMGMFRPEITSSIGIKNPVLAWGGGFERLAMLRFNLDDIRDLYTNKISWLKRKPKCL